MSRAPVGQPYSSWQSNDLVATELEQWVAYLKSDPDGFWKVRALMGGRISELRSAQRQQQREVA